MSTPNPKAKDRDLAIDAALFALLRLRNPLATTSNLLLRSSWKAVRGSGSYTCLIDGEPFARIDLDGKKRFTCTLL